jgi:hypothetical protein
MVTVPVVTPVTIPVLPMVATAVLLLLHTPPVTAFANVIVAPVQTVEGPVIVPALSEAPMFTVLVVTDVPQLLVTVYLIVSNPGLKADTTPLPLIAAMVVLVSPQTPPGTVLV